MGYERVSGGLGFQEGKQIVFVVCDGKGDLKAIEAACPSSR